MISIIVPIYNSESYLATCINSLLAQTVTELQIILVDDGSTDSSVTIAQCMAQQDPRIVLLRQPHAGQSVARNFGLKHAQGEYIAFVDADDALEPDWCACHLAAIEGVDYVQSGYKRVQSGSVISQKTPWYQYQFTSPCMRLYRRSIIADLSFAEGFIYEDVLFSTDLWVKGATCRRINHTGYLYTLNPDSTTARSHPEARQRVFAALRQKRQKASFRGKGIITLLMTCLRAYWLFA